MSDPDATRVESFTTELSVAIELVDGLTGEPPVGQPTLSVTNADYDVVRTPSGYYVLVDLPSDPPTVEVAVEAEAYLDEVDSITHDSLPAERPLHTIELAPGPGYPFGGGETVVRGVVEDDGEPVADAEVAYVQGSASARTDEKGGYALPIRDVDSADLGTDSDGNRVLEPGGGEPTIRATHPDGRTTDVDVPVTLGGTASAHLSF